MLTLEKISKLQKKMYAAKSLMHLGYINTKELEEKYLAIVKADQKFVLFINDLCNICSSNNQQNAGMVNPSQQFTAMNDVFAGIEIDIKFLYSSLTMVSVVEEMYEAINNYINELLIAIRNIESSKPSANKVTEIPAAKQTSVEVKEESNDVTLKFKGVKNDISDILNIKEKEEGDVYQIAISGQFVAWIKNNWVVCNFTPPQSPTPQPAPQPMYQPAMQQPQMQPQPPVHPQPVVQSQSPLEPNGTFIPQIINPANLKSDPMKEPFEYNFMSEEDKERNETFNTLNNLLAGNINPPPQPQYYPPQNTHIQPAPVYQPMPQTYYGGYYQQPMYYQPPMQPMYQTVPQGPTQTLNQFDMNYLADRTAMREHGMNPGSAGTPQMVDVNQMINALNDSIGFKQ